MDISGWKDFFVATASASAALAGLVIVAVSVNVKQIIEYRNLPSRAAATIASLVLILTVSCAGLIPDQRTGLLGVEVLVLTALYEVLALRAAHQAIVVGAPSERTTSQAVVEVTLSQVPVVLFAIGGFGLLFGAEGGLHWVAAGIITVFILSMVNAWVLLIEILR